MTPASCRTFEVPMSSTARPPRPLADLPDGACAEVVGVAGDDVLAHRLIAAGLWAGTRVEVLRRAPFGGPLELALRGFRLALRRTEARRVLVREERASR
jgi:ferrous iron transport protein A